MPFWPQSGDSDWNVKGRSLGLQGESGVEKRLNRQQGVAGSLGSERLGLQGKSAAASRENWRIHTLLAQNDGSLFVSFGRSW